MQMPDRLVLIIRDFLTDRSFRYRIEGTLSEPHPIRAGVPQGSVLSPTLYSLFTNDVPKHPKVQLGLFADDTAIYVTHPKPAVIRRYLQEAITALGQWFTRWRIEVNPDKSQAIVFHPSDRRLTSDVEPVRLFGSPIPWVAKAKYLGVTLDKKLNFRSHIKTVRDRANFILGRLSPMVNKFSKMSLRNKLTLYKTCVRPVMSYASVVFAHVSEARLKPLQVIQNKFLRRALGAPWYQTNRSMHRDMELISIRSFFRQASRHYFDRAPHHRNPLVRKTVDYVPGPPPLPTAIRQSLDRGRSVRRPRHVLIDPVDDFSAYIERWIAVESSAGRSGNRRVRTHRRPRRRGRPPRATHNTPQGPPSPQSVASVSSNTDRITSDIDRAQLSFLPDSSQLG